MTPEIKTVLLAGKFGADHFNFPDGKQDPRVFKEVYSYLFSHGGAWKVRNGHKAIYLTPEAIAKITKEMTL